MLRSEVDWSLKKKKKFISKVFVILFCDNFFKNLQILCKKQFSHMFMLLLRLRHNLGVGSPIKSKLVI